MLFSVRNVITYLLHEYYVGSLPAHFENAKLTLPSQSQLLPQSRTSIVSQPSKCLKFMTFREGCFVIRN